MFVVVILGRKLRWLRRVLPPGESRTVCAACPNIQLQFVARSETEIEIRFSV